MCPRSIQVDTTGRKQCVLFLEIVDFVDVDTIRGGVCDGGIETCEELLEGFALAAAKHGQGLASFGGDGHGADGVDQADHDLSTLGERIEIGIHGDGERRQIVLGGI